MALGLYERAVKCWKLFLLRTVILCVISQSKRNYRSWSSLNSSELQVHHVSLLFPKGENWKHHGKGCFGRQRFLITLWLAFKSNSFLPSSCHRFHKKGFSINMEYEGTYTEYCYAFGFTIFDGWSCMQ